MKESEILIYRLENGDTEIEVKLDELDEKMGIIQSDLDEIKKFLGINKK